MHSYYPQNLRVYTFTHVYLSSIQQGIQSGHAANELVSKYLIEEDDLLRRQMVADWSVYGKTIICLNGGNSASLHQIAGEIHTFADEVGLLPWAKFYEDRDSMENMLTGVSIVVPEYIWQLEPDREAYDQVLSHHEINPYAGMTEAQAYAHFRTFLSLFSLAR
jgi:hypothetical protein